MRRLTALTIVALACFGQAQDSVSGGRRIAAHPFVQPPVIDGDLSDEAWKDAPEAHTFIDKVTNQPVKEQTRTKVGVTTEGIYLAFVCLDSKPETILATSTREDQQFGVEDHVAVLLDPMNRRSNNTTSIFNVNAAGVKSARIAGGRAGKREWRGEWLAAAKRTDQGWQAEIFIPWSMMQTPGEGKHTVLFNLARVQARDQIVSFWSPLGVQELEENQGFLDGTPLPKNTIKPKLQMLGYLSPDYDEDRAKEFQLRAGLDLRIKPTDTMTAVASFNPDFQNIESAVAGIGFTRSERFVGETRPFFTEGAGYFRMSNGFSIGNLFYTQRIRDFDQGVKYFGDLDNKNQIGFLSTIEDGNQGDAVAVFRHNFKPRSFAIGYATHRSHPGTRSTLTGFSGQHYGSNFGIEYDFANSETNGTPGTAASFGVGYSVPNFFAVAKGIALQPTFNVPLGLIGFNNRRGGYLYMEYGRELRNGPIRRILADFYTENFEKFDRSHFQKSTSGGGTVIFRNDMSVRLGTFTDRFESEESGGVGVWLGFNVSHPYNQFYVGTQQDHRDGDPSTYYSVSGSYRLARGLDLAASFASQRYRGLTEQTRVTLGYEIDAEQSVAARWVSTSGKDNWYVSYRKSGGRGLEYFLIVGDPSAQSQRNRVALKLVWAK